jgi:hypothetical protein
MDGTLSFYLIDVVNQYRNVFDSNAPGSRFGATKNRLKTHLDRVIAESTNGFSSGEVWWGPYDWFPPLTTTDIVVYVVPDPKRSVIAANGGNVDLSLSDPQVLGLTDLNLRICEVYFDRAYDGSPSEIAGAAFHEAAHLKSGMGNEMHLVQHGNFAAKPDYNSSPTAENISFMATHITKQVKQMRRKLPR